MYKPSVLILAASSYQVPIIRKAHEMGFRVVTLDNCPSNPGHLLADASYNIDTTDVEAVLDISRKEKIGGLVAACTDVAVPTSAYVATKLDLPALPLNGCRILCNKAAFRLFQMQNDYPCPEWLESVQDDHQVNFDKKWILKPQSSSGSKGIGIARERKEFGEALANAQKTDPQGRTVLEEFIEGRQGTCEGLFVKGKIARCWITERLTAAAPYVATTGHRVPGLLNEIEAKNLRSQIESILQRLGFANTLFDADFVVGTKVTILEMSPRLGGNLMARLLEVATEVDLVRCALEVAMGLPISNIGQETMKCAQVIILGACREGQLSYNSEALNQLKQETWIHDVKIDRNIGDAVQAFSDGGKRVGEVVFSASNRDELLEREKIIRSLLGLKVISPE
jgi:biotin carboxylase